MFERQYADVFAGSEVWQALDVPAGQTFDWQADSTYVKQPPFFVDMPRNPPPVEDIRGARVLALLGDTVTTDHISPAGPISPDSPAGPATSATWASGRRSSTPTAPAAATTKS